MKVYLKIFFAFGFVYTVIIGGIKGLAEGAPGFLSALNWAFGLGLASSLILGTLHFFLTRKIAPGYDDSPRQMRSFNLSMSPDVAFERCLEAVRQIDGSEVVLEDRENGGIKARTSWGLRSAGENIHISLSSQPNDQVNVEITSSPTIRTTILDYGKGYENVENILRLIVTPDLLHEIMSPQQKKETEEKKPEKPLIVKSVREERPEKPRIVEIAVILLYVALGYRILRTMMKVSTGGEEGLWSSYTYVSIMLLGTMFITIFLIQAGKNWARIAFMAFFILYMPFYGYALMQSLVETPIFGLFGILQTAIQITALVLLFQKPSSDWFLEMRAKA